MTKTQNLDRFKFRARILEEESGFPSYKKGDFVEGYFYEEVEDNEDSDSFLHYYYIKINYGDHFADFKIDVKTLGQSTGFRDKNGKLIYEGDIVKGVFDPHDKEKRNVLWRVVYSKNFASFIVALAKNLDRPTHCFFFGRNINPNEIEIIGNIYENPELLEENNK